ncbi:AraC family transcriptional regulator [Pseudoalteromonas denitrificans]|uniref:AraC-type DNA-binding protein n=1 Tax=Pseudoalteromonas denitrificans DSM 6059 TaxID=1123010 RepID=A0A1I1LXL7_9GAMM|nr:AraC family transcriptional regulator [Pseudoalteromonas denitrificans]SFC77859.1 AraC-type DNA-binding protein [Pseudoalteromonas denitrificans DSM 6059]
MTHSKTLKPLGYASIPAVNQYLQLAEEQNINVSDILKKLNMNHDLLADNSKQISGELFQALIFELVGQSNDPLFGLHTAKFVQPGSYSVLGFITMNCETLGEAITKIQPFEKLVGDMGTTELTKKNSELYISWNCIFPNEIVKQHMIDNCLASWFTFAQFLVDPKFKENSLPKQVLLKRSMPTLEQEAQYQALFKCPVLFNQIQDAIVFEQELFNLPLNKGNKQILSTLEEHAEQLINKLGHTDDFSSKVSDLIESNLQSGSYHQQNIADLLKVSTKTMQRKLKSEHTQFQTLLDTVRLKKAQLVLANSDLPLTQLSIELGFCESRSFYRWFQKLTGITPGEYRQGNTNI